MRDHLPETLIGVLMVLVLMLIAWRVFDAEHKCERSGGVYTRDHGCLHRTDIPR